MLTSQALWRKLQCSCRRGACQFLSATYDLTMFIDALQYIPPSRAIFEQMRVGRLSAVHITVGYHEDFLGVVANLQNWNRWFEDCGDLIASATTCEEISAANDAGKTAILFGLQNPLAIGADLGRVEILAQLGIRFCQVTYNQQSLLGAGCFEPNDSGLTAFGQEVVTEMNRLGMVIDLSHAGHKTAMDVVAFSNRPVTVTHANPDAWHPAPRNLHHDLLQALSDTGGMVGFSLYPHHLKGGSACALSEFSQMVADMVRAYGSQMFGIGSDLCQDQPDGVVNWMRNGHWRKTPVLPVAFPACPVWFRDNCDFPGLSDGLFAAGLPAEHVAGILGSNWMAFWDKAFAPS
jgi:membrane dipeptidase